MSILRAPKNADELSAYIRVVATAFGSSDERALSWLGDKGDDVRLLKRDGSIDAGLLRVPMGQYFGGKRVSTWGVAGVATDLRLRGQGLARRLMRACVRDALKEGVALSTLYASTAALYRSAGYETAGHRCRLELNIRELRRPNDSLERHLYEPDRDRSQVIRLYRERARLHPGWLDRSHHLWDRMHKEIDGRPLRGVLFGDRDRPSAHVLYTTSDSTLPDDHYTLEVKDLAYRDAAGIAAVVRFLTDHGTVTSIARLPIAPHDPLILRLVDDRLALQTYTPWMLRIVDIKQALEARGYSKSFALNLRLGISDEVISANRGTIRLRIQGGQADVGRTKAAPQLRMGVGTLAALYSGYADALQLQQSGFIEGTATAAQQLGSAFSGARPTMPDFF